MPHTRQRGRGKEEVTLQGIGPGQPRRAPQPSPWRVASSTPSAWTRRGACTPLATGASGSWEGASVCRPCLPIVSSSRWLQWLSLPATATPWCCCVTGVCLGSDTLPWGSWGGEWMWPPWHLGCSAPPTPRPFHPRLPSRGKLPRRRLVLRQPWRLPSHPNRHAVQQMMMWYMQS